MASVRIGFVKSSGILDSKEGDIVVVWLDDAD